MSPAKSGQEDISPAMRRRAAQWLAQREGREFSAAETAEFSDWLAADSQHRAAFMEVSADWARLDALSAYPRRHDAAPDPDLLRAPRKLPNWAIPTAMAASLALAVGGWLFSPSERSSGEIPSPVTQLVPTLVRLSDGSQVELNAGAEVIEHFTSAARRVSLLRGEAHFTVVTDAARPFVVEAGGVKMQAVGTAFNVRLDPASVELLVTHGRVQMILPASPAAHASPPSRPSWRRNSGSSCR